MILENNEDDESEYGWRIDGKLYSPNQVAKLFSSYEGWQIFFQAMDRSDDVLQKDMFLMPMKMNDDIFVDELKELVMTFSDKGTQDDINYLKELNFKDFSDGKLYQDYFYVLLDKKWLLSKEIGDDFLGNKKIPICEALSSQEP